MDKSVIVAMSGGVDSSVAAALLVEKGYDVIGIMLRLWTSDCGESTNTCCTPESINQAREVANILNIPFYTIDSREIFKNEIVDQFIHQSLTGLTPNPCFTCNQKIKWGVLLEKAEKIGAKYIATGHYAQIVQDEFKKFHLLNGIDEKKDQSYMLAGLKQEQLCRTLLPLGKLYKNDVRKIALKYGFRSANKPDSQDLCFTGKNGYRSFINAFQGDKNLPGDIKNFEGVIIGNHTGLANYTIGQRKGLGSGSKSPLYVISKNIEKNELVVGPFEKLGTKNITVTKINWISGIYPSKKDGLQVKTRYKSTPVFCSIEMISEELLNIQTVNEIRDAAPGQIAVFYHQDYVIGSGVIVSTGRG
ncbi:MAG: tRNA 2-thiouridine(34) synthase MnmA [Chloroflexi bacterium]|nr:tRNA 2-thiouridine(34) synthase MnmA [Chloroflexota bacterium]